VGHWYKSFTFWEGMRSHILHLKQTAHEILENQEHEELSSIEIRN
jgi:hypothetical protein